MFDIMENLFAQYGVLQRETLSDESIFKVWALLHRNHSCLDSLIRIILLKLLKTKFSRSKYKILRIAYLYASNAAF